MLRRILTSSKYDDTKESKLFLPSSVNCLGNDQAKVIPEDVRILVSKFKEKWALFIEEETWVGEVMQDGHNQSCLCSKLQDNESFLEFISLYAEVFRIFFLDKECSSDCFFKLLSPYRPSQFMAIARLCGEAGFKISFSARGCQR